MNIKLFPFIAAFCCAQQQQSNQTISTNRRPFFSVKPTSVSLTATLPQNTQIYKTWPNDRQRIDLPENIQVIVINDGNILMGPVIHVQTGDRLQLTLTNEVPLSGLSLHLHGLNLGGAFEYDGAVGVAQCPLAEGNSFTYDVIVDDDPGTYWYHTSSGRNFGGVAAYDAVRGPLIVHSEGTSGRYLVNMLNTPNSSSLPFGYTPIAYANERIIFFQDGSLLSASQRYSQHVGGLVPPPSKNDGVIVSTSPWHFGTCNGKLREVIHVKSGQRYLFRLINGGQHHALRFSLDGFPLTVVAVDSQQVEPYSVDQIVIHVGERFDVEVFIFGDLDNGELFWIRADTLEPQTQGFQNGIRAILRVSSDLDSTPGDSDVPDPPQNIVSSVNVKGTSTLNCYGSKCIPITALSPLSITQANEKSDVESEIHFVDSAFQPAPQYAHFVSIDDSVMTQNEFPPSAMGSRTFRPLKSMHPHSMALRVDRSSSVIIVWRTTLLMDVPIHIHGHTVEILDIATPVLNKDCNLQSCKLSEAFERKENLKALDSTPPNQAIGKDTFVIPAGGAIVTRMKTDSRRGLWMVNGQRDIHEEDGLSFVLIVGDYRIPKVDDNFPSDFPTCNSTLVKSITLNPHCECYTDNDTPLQLQMSGDGRKFCSRDHLCRHEISHASNLDSYAYDSGFNIQSAGLGSIPKFIPVLVFVLIALATVTLVIVLPPVRLYSASDNEEAQTKYDGIFRRLSSLGIGTRPSHRRLRSSNIEVNIESSSSESSPSSMIGFSLNVTSHIGTVNENINEEEEDDENDSANSSSSFASDAKDADAPPPPPQPIIARASHSTKTACKSRPSTSTSIVAGSGGLPPPPPRRLNTQNSTSDFFSFRNHRRSTLSTTFERIFCERGNDDKAKQELKDAFEFVLDGYSVKGKVDISVMDEVVHQGSSFKKQLSYLFPIQWQVYFPSCVNLLRLVEVAGLALMTGLLFQGVGRDNTRATINDLSSLVLVLTIMWTYCRLFSSITSYAEWWRSTRIVFSQRRFSLMPVFVARTAVVLLCESMFPMIVVFITFPIVGLVGDIRSLCNCSFLLACCNMCYMSLGAVLGMSNNVSHSMTAATIFCQVSILTSGVFSELPGPSLSWAKHLSPFYWTVRGLLKSVFHWSDTYECINASSSEVEANQCFIEYDHLIEQYNRRELNVATFNDSSSDSVLTEAIVLVTLTVCLHMLMLGKCFVAYYKIQLMDVLAILGDIVDAIFENG